MMSASLVTGPAILSVRKLFLATIAGKMAASLAGWWFGSPWLLGFAVPLALMAVYIAMGLRRGDDGISDEKFADSCYYLGFIFTISSILIALLDVPAISTRLGDIAVRFGAALVSTVLGLIVRIYLVNFRPEFQDGYRQAETSLLESVRTFRMHLDLSVDKLNEFQAQVGEASRLAVARSDLAIRDAAALHAQQFGEMTERMAADYRRHFEESTVHLKASSQTLSAALYDYAQALVAGTGRFESKVEGFVAGLEARTERVALPEDYFSRRLDPALAGLQRSLVATSENMADASTALKGNVIQMSNALETVGERVHAMAASMEGVRTALEGQEELLASAREQALVLRQLAGSLDKLDNSVSRSLASIGTLEQTVRQMVEEAGKVVQSNREIGLLVNRQSEVTADVQRGFAAWLPQSRESHQLMVERLEATTKAFDRSLGQVASALADQGAALSRLAVVKSGESGGPDGNERPASGSSLDKI